MNDEKQVKEECRRLLVVDDSQTARNYHLRILQSVGYVVDTASDGASALEKLTMHQYHMIITDVNMTSMNGLEFVRRLRRIEAYQFAPVIIVSTERDAEDKRQGYLAGASLYLTKPCRTEILIESVNMLIR